MWRQCSQSLRSAQQDVVSPERTVQTINKLQMQHTRIKTQDTQDAHSYMFICRLHMYKMQPKNSHHFLPRKFDPPNAILLVHGLSSTDMVWILLLWSRPFHGRSSTSTSRSRPLQPLRFGDPLWFRLALGSCFRGRFTFGNCFWFGHCFGLGLGLGRWGCSCIG